MNKCTHEEIEQLFHAYYRARNEVQKYAVQGDPIPTGIFWEEDKLLIKIIELTREIPLTTLAIWKKENEKYNE